MGDLEKTVNRIQIAFALDGDDFARGIIINPARIMQHSDKMASVIYKDFRTRNPQQSVNIESVRDVQNIAKYLARNFDTSIYSSISGCICSIHATLSQATTIIEDIRNNPKEYYDLESINPIST